MAGLGKEGKPNHKFNYNGKEKQEEFGLHWGDTRWHDYGAKMYDAQLGRWHAVDPQGQFASPYTGMGNNPVMMVDPDGELAFLATLGKVALGTAGIYAAEYTANTAASKGGFDNWNWGHFTAAAGRGALVGATSHILSIGGLEIAHAISKKEQLIDGFINLSYQLFATSTSSVLSNGMNDGWNKAFSDVQIGVGDFRFSIKNGKFKMDALDILNNSTTIFNNALGFIDVLRNKADLEFDRSTLSFRFKENFNGYFGYKDVKINKKTGMADEGQELIEDGKYSIVGQKLANASSPGFVTYGLYKDASYLRFRFSQRHQIEESLHGIQSRIGGKFLPFISYHFFGDKNTPYKKRWWEKMVKKFVN